MSLTPYLTVADARAAVAFYVQAFGAVPDGDPVVMDDGRTGHAEVLVGGVRLMLADEFPEIGLLGPRSRGGVSVSLHLEVPDVDAVVGRAVRAGGALERPVADSPYGRTGVVVDPAGHRWMVQSPLEVQSPLDVQSPSEGAGQPAGRHGDVGYQSLLVPDVGRTQSFFGAVLGWTYVGGNAEGGWEAEGVRPRTGLMGGAERPEVQLCFQVDDMAAALARVRAAGGRGREPDARPYGLLAECVDDQGMRFQLWQPQ